MTNDNENSAPTAGEPVAAAAAPMSSAVTSAPSAHPYPGHVAGNSGPGAGSTVMNLLWLFLSGFWLFLSYLLAGVIQCITVIGIPFGIQSFKIAGFALWPFGRTVVKRPGASSSLSLVGNIVWIVFSGLWLALVHTMLGVLLCLTVIGIPLGLGNFKLIPLALAPFGKDIVRTGSVVGTGRAPF